MPSAKELTKTLLYRRRDKVLCVYLKFFQTYCDIFVKVSLRQDAFAACSNPLKKKYQKNSDLMLQV